MAVNVMESPSTNTKEKPRARGTPGLSSRRPAMKLIISGIMASTQGFEAVRMPPTNTATIASHGFVLMN